MEMFLCYEIYPKTKFTTRFCNKNTINTIHTMKNIDDRLFQSFVEDVKQRIKAAQYRALQTVNKEQIALFALNDARFDQGEILIRRSLDQNVGL